MPKITFEKWMKQVNAKIASRCGGLDSEDLPDVCYSDFYEDGLTPTQAAREAIRYAME